MREADFLFITDLLLSHQQRAQKGGLLPLVISVFSSSIPHFLSSPCPSIRESSDISRVCPALHSSEFLWVGGGDDYFTAGQIQAEVGAYLVYSGVQVSFCILDIYL